MTKNEMLQKWLDDKEIDALLVVGVKGGAWQWSTSLPTFEFLAGAEGVIQKLKHKAFNLEETQTAPIKPTVVTKLKRGPQPPEKR